MRHSSQPRTSHSQSRRHKTPIPLEYLGAEVSGLNPTNLSVGGHFNRTPSKNQIRVRKVPRINMSMTGNETSSQQAPESTKASNLINDIQIKQFRMQNERAFYSAVNNSPRSFVKAGTPQGPPPI